MAVLANIVRRQVVCGLSSRLAAIVARKTIATNAGMIKSNIRPHRRRMTIAAIGVCNDVAGGLSFGGAAVVTGRAVAHYSCVIEPDNCPAICRMTLLAVIVGAQVHRRLSGRERVIMARSALARRARKDTIEVTAFAIHALMSSIKRKPRRKVIGNLLGGD